MKDSHANHRSLLSGNGLRAPSAADIAEITALIQAANIRVSGEPDFSQTDLEAEWGLEGFDPARHAFIVTRGDAIVAYANFRSRKPFAEYDGDYSLLPAAADADLEALVIRELERRMLNDFARGPGGEDTWMHLHADAVETERLQRYAQHGFEACRWYFRMGVDLETAPAQITPPPAGIEIRSCRRGEDEGRFYDVLSDAFRDHYRFTPLEKEDWVRRHAGYDFYVPDLWLLAWHGDTPVGASCNLLYEDAGWVDELGVRRDWRGRKLGRALLDATFAAFWKHGQPHVRLTVDSGNATGATQLYEHAGMSVLRKYVLYRKAMRAAGGARWGDRGMPPPR